MSSALVTTPQGPIPALGIPNGQDYPRLVFTAPYFETVPLAELIEPSVLEAVQSALPALVPQYVQDAANTAVAQTAVMLSGSTMSGPLFLSPVLPTQPAQAASMAYVDLMVSTAGVPEVPPVPQGQTWARQTGQWVPVAEAEGTFLALGGGTMQGSINMSGNGITGLPAIPQLPNGAASAQWVLNQIAAQSLYQGTWTPDTNTPDLTLSGTHQNGFTWIATTTSLTGVVVSQPIPGLQGLTIFNGDTVIFAAMVGQFQAIHAGGLSLPEAQSLFVSLTGSQMSGPLLLNADPTSAMEAATRQWVLAQTTAAGLPEAPATGLLYGRNGVSNLWSPVLPLAGGILTGALTLSGNAVSALSAVPLQQLTSSMAGYVPLTGNVTVTGSLTLTGASSALTLNSNAALPLQAVPLQQLTAVMGAYVPLVGGTLTGPLTLAANAAAPLQPVPLQQLQAGYLPLAGGHLTGNLMVAPATDTLPPGLAAGLNIFLDGNFTTGTASNYAFNAFPAAGAGWNHWQTGYSGIFTLDSNAGVMRWLLGATGAAGSTIVWGNQMVLDMSGNLQLLGYLHGGWGALDAGLLKSAGSPNVIGFSWGIQGGANPQLAYFIDDGAAASWICTQTNATMFAYAGGTAGPTGATLNGFDIAGNIYGIFVDAVSDERVKANIVPTDVDALAVLRAVPVRQFDIKADAAAAIYPGSKSEKAQRLANGDVHCQIGLVGQELAPLIPEMVTILQQPEGHDPALPSDLRNIIYQLAAPYLIRAAQQIADRMDVVEAQLLGGRHAG